MGQETGGRGGATKVRGMGQTGARNGALGEKGNGLGESLLLASSFAEATEDRMLAGTTELSRAPKISDKNCLGHRPSPNGCCALTSNLRCYATFGCRHVRQSLNANRDNRSAVPSVEMQSQEDTCTGAGVKTPEEVNSRTVEQGSREEKEKRLRA